MKLLDLSFKDIIQEDKKLTFLIGAGCSIDAPSCLPAGREMMNAIINYICEEYEKDKILRIKELRFEALVELVRDFLDKDLKVIDYYGLCEKPNLQHFFLADMIQKGHFVMTTNFDFLIEYALLQLGIPKEEIKVIITRRDFEKYNNPDDLFNQNIKTIYKIHGSAKNIVKNKDTKNTLVATIQAFGSNKEGMNVFQIEPFKKDMFENITNHRSLVIMGYSGSDDFDVVPTLKALKNIEEIIWINYIPDDNGKENVYEFEYSHSIPLEGSDKVNQILFEISKMQNCRKIYRIDTNTTRLVKEFIDINLKESMGKFEIEPSDWLKDNIKTPNEIERYYFPFKIYFDFNLYEDALRVNEKLYQKAKEAESYYWMGSSLNNTALILQRKGEYKESLEKNEKAIEYAKKIGDKLAEATRLLNMANLYRFLGKYENSLQTYQSSLQINREINNKSGEATCLNNIGSFYYDIGKHSEAFQYFGDALKIYEELGDLTKRAICLKNIGDIYLKWKDFEKALNYNEQALKIANQLGSIAEITRYVSSLGKIYYEQKNYSLALKNYEEVLKNYQILEDKRGLATIYNNLGSLYKNMGDFDKAIKNYKDALNIDDEIKNVRGKAIRLNNLGDLYYKQNEFLSALEIFKESLKINDQLGRLDSKANVLNSMAIVNKALKRNSDAIKNYEEAIKIYKELGNIDRANQIYSNLSNFLKKLENNGV